MLSRYLRSLRFLEGRNRMSPFLRSSVCECCPVISAASASSKDGAVTVFPPMTPPRSTRARYVAVAFAMLLAIIQYLDRVCISQAGPAISRDLGLSKVELGWVFSVFTWAYALFEVPGGWLGDRIGPRRVLLPIVAWRSFFAAAAGWARSAASLLLARELV